MLSMLRWLLFCVGINLLRNLLRGDLCGEHGVICVCKLPRGYLPSIWQRFILHIVRRRHIPVRYRRFRLLPMCGGHLSGHDRRRTLFDLRSVHGR